MPNLLLMAGLLCEVVGIAFVYVFALADDLDRKSPVGSAGLPTRLMSLSERRGVACLAMGLFLQVVSYVVVSSRRIFDAGGVKEGRRGLRSALLRHPWNPAPPAPRPTPQGSHSSGG